MDNKSIDTLELPKILERLASYAAFSASKDMAQNLVPTEDLSEAKRRQAATSEARTLLRLSPDLSIGGAHDMRPEVGACIRGVILEPTQLLDLKSTLISARKLRRRFDKLEVSLPILTSLANELEPPLGLIDAISKTLDERGEVLDNASEKLASIRREMKVVHDRLTSKLQRTLNDPKAAPMLQEPIITQRDGRFVIPLRAEFKGRIKSVIHDQSASGATLFIEPLSVVDLNNKMQELQLAERDEIRRILSDLSRRVGEEADVIIRTVDTLAELDLAFAKARYAEALGAIEPILKSCEPHEGSPHPGSTVHLLQARHPLLDPGSVVPIDLILDADTYALVITGPNTGGKTVTLKTAGLLALMAQSGLHIPAASGSELSVFDSVYADIGDEQSIEQSLSTFSSHISNIIHILKRATARSLVLLDELGAGTDPQEGSALARAILGDLLEGRVTSLVATHFPELKAFAHATPGARNASVEFDLESLRPTYHLTIGLPGRSNALAIAKRLGLDPEIVEDASELISPEELQADSLLDEIRNQRDAARRDRAEAEQQRTRVQALESELTRRLAGIEGERLELLEQAQAEAEAELEAFRKQLRDLHRRLTNAGKPLEDLKPIQAEAEDLTTELSEPIAQHTQDIDLPRSAFRIGDHVRLHTIDAKGVIIALDQEQAEVQVGRLRIRARLDELAIPREEALADERHQVVTRDVKRTEGIGQPPPLELHLRGRTVDEGLEELERHLDAAFLTGMPFVRVVHGKGSGRLREAIRHALRDNPYVTSFEPGKAGEGGEGVTVVWLANA